VRQPRTAFIREFLVVKSRVGEKSEALKDSAIVELLRVVDQELEICGLAPKKGKPAIRLPLPVFPMIAYS
jgi:hypothetical protein